MVCFEMSIRSGRNAASISFNRSSSEPQPKKKNIYMSLLIDLTLLHSSSPLLNVYIPLSISTHTQSFAENRAFQTARAFHPVVVDFYTNPELLA